MLIKKQMNRRRMLRGALNGLGVAVALPFLDCFLDGNGTALASGEPLPVRFGTWFWALGMDEKIFVPKKVGAGYDLPPQIEAWKGVEQHINVYTNYNVLTDGKPNLCHFTGWVALRAGSAPPGRGILQNPSIDVLVGDAIGGANRFRALDCAASGSIRDTYSFRGSDSLNAPVTSPIELYQKIFGSEFQDPNSPEFKPSTEIMVRKSVLSGIDEQSGALKNSLGAADKARLDQYFTGLRELEQRLALQLVKPPPAPSCKVPNVVDATPRLGIDTDTVAWRHNIMADLMAMAVACNQTRVFNMNYANSNIGCTRRGSDKTHHLITHEEPIDQTLGYQPTNDWFIKIAMESWAYYVKAFQAVPEGAGTLLDNTVIYAHSDQSLAKTHSVVGIPMMTAGRAGGRLRTGIHVNGKGEAGTSLGFTLMTALGMKVSEWGQGSMKVSRQVSEIVI
jgi:hypothetical protein